MGRRGGYRRLSDEERAERMDAAHEQLVTAVKALTSSEDWLAMLDTARRLPAYSPRNCLLLAAQGAQGMVMGYQAWRQIPAVGGGICQVAKGATSLKVLAPLTRTVTDTDPVTGSETTGPRVVGFKLISVFDQTSLIAGPDVPGPELLTPVLLEGSEPAPHLWDALAAQVTAAGYHLDTSADLAERIAPANGRTDYLAGIVAVRPDLPAAQQLKTLTHELAHVLLHGPDQRPPGLTRAMAEVEAESVAYLVTAELGLDSSVYTIPYVTGWAGGDSDTILATAHRAITTARTITDTLHQHLTLAPPETGTPPGPPEPDATPLGPDVPGPGAAGPGAAGSGVAAAVGPRLAAPRTPPDDGPDGWPDFLDDTPTQPGPGPRSGPDFGPGLDQSSPWRGSTGPQGQGDWAAVGDGITGPGLDMFGAVVVGTATGSWRLRWEPSRAALTAVHLTDPAMQDLAEVPDFSDPPVADEVSTVHVPVLRERSAAGTTAALEEALGFALPAAVRDHLTTAQLARPATPPPAAPGPPHASAVSAIDAAFGAHGDAVVHGPTTGGRRDFTRLYPDLPADVRVDAPSTSRLTAPGTTAAAEAAGTGEAFAAGPDDQPPLGPAQAPTTASLILIPGHEPLTYASALAVDPPLRAWSHEPSRIGIQILSTGPDPDYPGHQAISYRITHHDRVIFAGDDLLAPLGSDPASDEALRQAADLAAHPRDDIPPTPAQSRFTRTHAGELTALVAEPAQPYPPGTRIRVTLPEPAPALPAFENPPSPEPAAQITGTVVQAINPDSSGDGRAAAAYAWRPDIAALPGHPWADNPGHALIDPAHRVEPTLAGPDVGLTGWTAATPLAFGATITFPADDGHTVHAHVLRTFTTRTDPLQARDPALDRASASAGDGTGEELVYEVQPTTPGIEPLRVPATAVTPVTGTAWPSIAALTEARDHADLPLQPGELLTDGTQTAHVSPGPDGPQITRTRHTPTTPAAPDHRLPAATLPATDQSGSPVAPGIAPGAGGDSGLHTGLDTGGGGGEVRPCAGPDCGQDATVTVTVGWPSGHREITDRCRPCAAQITLVRLTRGCGIDITPLPDTAAHLPTSPNTAHVANSRTVSEAPAATSRGGHGSHPVLTTSSDGPPPAILTAPPSL